MAIPDCPRCGGHLNTYEVLRRRNNWGGYPPRPRPELWWRCAPCGWLGLQHREDGELRTMRPLTGDDGDCPFCGEEESNVAGPPWPGEDGRPRELQVCLACGTGNVRYSHPPSPEA
ncbi:hypothetical protein ACWEQL_05975 [Kitasatospora sp. NPDC004240]